MEVELGSSEKARISPSQPFLSKMLERFNARVVGLMKKVKKIGEDDPRRIFHSLKVGFALTLVSTFYYVTPLFNGFGVSAMWAVLTVVVVMEYTVGGTLSKGLNRAFATLVAGVLGMGAHHIATLCGEEGEPILLGIFVFLLAAAATFSRFIPEIKARYDYGVTIFILTFSLVTVSSYRVGELMQMAHQRLSTIAIGVATCLFTSIFVLPVWAGEDLHKQAALNLEKLASFLEGLGAEYLGEKVGVQHLDNKPFPQGYKSVLDSKPSEDSLFNFAGWEPGHGCFAFRHPWKQYIKIGGLTRQCAYSMEALNAYYITKSETQTASTESEFCRRLQVMCMEMSSESGKALMEVASAIKTMTLPSSTVNQHMAVAIAATNNLRTSLFEDNVLPEVLHAATVANLLLEIVRCTQEIVVSVGELAHLAHFKSSDEEIRRTASVKPITDAGGSHHVSMAVED